jgi:hypothetical protein
VLPPTTRQSREARECRRLKVPGWDSPVAQGHAAPRESRESLRQVQRTPGALQDVREAVGARATEADSITLEPAPHPELHSPEPPEALLARAQAHATGHRAELLRSDRCGCFACGAIFLPTRIVQDRQVAGRWRDHPVPVVRERYGDRLGLRATDLSGAAGDAAALSALAGRRRCPGVDTRRPLLGVLAAPLGRPAVHNTHPGDAAAAVDRGLSATGRTAKTGAPESIVARDSGGAQWWRRPRAAAGRPGLQMWHRSC